MLFYLPLLEPASNTEEDDDDFLQDAPEERHVDFVVPFQKSVKQIVREVSFVASQFHECLFLTILDQISVNELLL